MEGGSGAPGFPRVWFAHALIERGIDQIGFDCLDVDMKEKR